MPVNQPRSSRSARVVGSWRYVFVVVAVLALLLLAVSSVSASAGDNAPEYQACVELCRRKQCERRVADAVIDIEPLPWYLRLLHWTCPDDCRYHCQHSITAARLERGEPVLQYHGKWPFTRILGMQEPASVLFSLLNGYGHWRYLPRIMERISPHYYMRKDLILYAIVGLNIWLWSAVFHVRDTPFTEKLDYFSAGLGILYGLYLVVRRVWRVRSPLAHLAIVMVCVGCYFAHVTYLTIRPRFDYSYNMAVCASVGLLHNLVWLGWTIRHYKSRPYAWRAAALVIYVTFAMSLELFDFAPLLWILDAHALWHAATVPLVFWWYQFLLLDYEWEMRQMGSQVLLPLIMDGHEVQVQPLIHGTRKIKD
ncbi:Per1-like-domain-containing protein [Syncephalis pseudoplumigaleata]|uniref:Post-GPI attachment to proteins factor 3 n=1 Tax=Syncephalis pseudoplumigaleata TaxID=1712513 RepID=A0A4P9Z5M1_9FUNG|nr:Per1-like-domain-containing protein [Syncephalis pseudoplumigaleata]|eukprot:RKP27101.1 Per1-like-domain-containing protein [Syncephalis pseudoplumigaleata]